LTAAYYLAIEGYPVTVFERLPVAGGMMAVGIPEFRLPRRVLQAEIDKVKQLGVEIKLNVEIGKDVTFQALKKDYEAIFIAIGCHRPIKLGVEGEDELKGVIDGITFLRDFHLGRPTLLKEKAVVIGGGSTAVDSARVAKRLGFPEVSILYRRTRDEMLAVSYEVDEAIGEGIKMEFLTSPTKIIGKDGEVCALECMHMKLGEPDESGRRSPIPIEGSEFEVKTDVVITALSQQPELGPLYREEKFATSKQGFIMVDPKTGETNVPGIFAAGDVVSGPRTVVEAVGFGKEVARSIDLLLRGEDPKAARRREWQGMEFRPEHVQARERVAMPRTSLSEGQRSFKEIELGFGEQEARAEADRCLRLCGIQRVRNRQ
jgi:NADPH-dependent glutamate synthase beta subunit-like oxidoreductase